MQRALLVRGESWRESAAKQRHGLNFIGCRWLVGWLPPRKAHEHVARYLLVWAPRHLLTYVHLCICQFVSTANAHTNTHTHSASALKKWMMLLHGNSIYPFHGDFYGSSNCFSYKFTIMIIRTDWTFSFWANPLHTVLCCLWFIFHLFLLLLLFYQSVRRVLLFVPIYSLLATNVFLYIYIPREQNLFIVCHVFNYWRNKLVCCDSWTNAGCRW